MARRKGLDGLARTMADGAWLTTQSLMQKDEAYAADEYASRTDGYQARTLKRVLSTVLPTSDQLSYRGEAGAVGVETGGALTEEHRRFISAERLMAARLGFCVTQTSWTPARNGSTVTFSFRPFTAEELPDLHVASGGTFESEGKEISRRDAQLLATAKYWAHLPPGHFIKLLLASSEGPAGAPTSHGLTRLVEDVDRQAVTGRLTASVEGAGLEASYYVAAKRQIAELLGYEIDPASRWRRVGSTTQYELTVGGVDPTVGGPERLQAFQSHSGKSTPMSLAEARAL